jgi:hypothetical protein
MNNTKQPPISPRNKKRVLIAQDVLASLAISRFHASPGSLISGGVKRSIVGTDYVSPNNDISCQEGVKNLKTCSVCANGALLLATIARFNHVTQRQLLDVEYNNVHELVPLKNIFGRQFMHTLELVFEGKKFGWHELPKAKQDLALAFHRKLYTEFYEDEKRRVSYDFNFWRYVLTTLMENIIANNGKLVLQ